MDRWMDGWVNGWVDEWMAKCGGYTNWLVVVVVAAL